MGLPREAIMDPAGSFAPLRGGGGGGGGGYQAVFLKQHIQLVIFQERGSGPLSPLLDLPLSMKVSCRTGFLKDCLARVC